MTTLDGIAAAFVEMAHTIVWASVATVDRDGREVARGGTPVPLSSLEFDLLAALADAPGRVFSRRQLLERVWGDDVYSDQRVVDVHIRSLRARLGDDATDPHLIATVRSVGYKFIGRPA